MANNDALSQANFDIPCKTIEEGIQSNCPIPFKTILELNSHLVENPPEEHDALIATLPLQPLMERPIAVKPPFRLYKGVWISEFFLRGTIEMQQRFKSRSTDIILASSPKSGTTWLKALLFATLTRTNYPLDQHPLHSHNPHQCVTSINREIALGRSKLIEAIPSPRVLSTHLPYQLLSDSIKNSDCRIVYVWRDPKDVLVSTWFFVKNIWGGADKVATFEQFYEAFCQGINHFGPIWNHVLGYWEESKRRPKKILFLKYEHIMQEPVKHATQLAHFIGCPYSDAEESQGVVEQIVELCSFKKLKDLEVNKVGKYGLSVSNVSNACFFRKGEAGNWKSHMTEEMAKKLDTIIEEKLKGSGLEI